MKHCRKICIAVLLALIVTPAAWAWNFGGHMLTGAIAYDVEVAGLLKGVAWKDVNTKFKNDYEKTLAYIFADMSEANRERISAEVEHVGAAVARLNLSMLGSRTKPPTGY